MYDASKRFKLDHVGMATHDLTRTVEQYRELFGFELIRGPIRVAPDSPGGSVHRDVFGDSWTGCQIAYLLSPDRIGLEVFQFHAPRDRGHQFTTVGDHDRPEPAHWLDYRKPGAFHIAFLCGDVAAGVRRIEQVGGVRRSAIHQTKTCNLVYCEDVAGAAVELIDRSFAALHVGR